MFIQPSARRVHSKPSYMEAGLQITLARRNNIIFLNYYQKSHNLLISNENIIIIFFMFSMERLFKFWSAWF